MIPANLRDSGIQNVERHNEFNPKPQPLYNKVWAHKWPTRHEGRVATIAFRANTQGSDNYVVSKPSGRFYFSWQVMEQEFIR